MIWKTIFTAILRQDETQSLSASCSSFHPWSDKNIDKCRGNLFSVRRCVRWFQFHHQSHKNNKNETGAVWHYNFTADLSCDMGYVWEVVWKTIFQFHSLTRAKGPNGNHIMETNSFSPMVSVEMVELCVRVGETNLSSSLTRHEVSQWDRVASLARS